MTDITIKDGETTTAPAQDAVTEGVKVAEQIIETAHVLKAQGDNRILDLLHDTVSRLNVLVDKLDSVDGKLDRIEMQVINNTISVENVIDDLSDVADVAIEAVEKVDAPPLESVEVREEPEKKKRVWL